MSEIDSSKTNGSGVGLDLGGAYELASGLRFGLVIENLINATSWDDSHLVYYRKQFRLTQNGRDRALVQVHQHVKTDGRVEALRRQSGGRDVGADQSSSWMFSGCWRWCFWP